MTMETWKINHTCHHCHHVLPMNYARGTRANFDAREKNSRAFSKLIFTLDSPPPSSPFPAFMKCAQPFQLT